MKAQVAPAALASYIRSLLKLPTTAGGGMPANVDRLLANRFFQGTITSFYFKTSAFYCQIARTGETLADGNTYLCVTPGYTPAVGDVVECLWRDLNSGYVWAALNRRVNGPRGYLLSAVLTSNIGSITTNQDLIGLGPLVVTAWDATRVYRLSCQANMQSTIAGDVMTIKIQLGGNVLQAVSGVEPTIGEGVSLAGSVILLPGDLGYPGIAPLPGTTTSYKLTGERTTGTGTVTLNAAPQGPTGRPAYFLIEDIGSTT